MKKSLFKNLEFIEFQLASICEAKSICADNLELHLDRFSEDEEECILQLLNKKLNLQEAIFLRQGGNLDNIIFLVK